MPKVLKIILPLMLVLGIVYGLAKAQIIPTQKLGSKNKSLGAVLHVVGLYHPKANVKVAAAVAPAPKTLSPDQQALKAQREALDQERAAWETQKQAQQKAEDKAKQEAVNAIPDPRELARLATVYEQMPAESVVKIFMKMPETQVIALMRRMDEKRVGEVLAAIAPERAAFFTQALSRPATPEHTASAAP